MADEKNPSQRYGATPKKLALIGVLAVVLLGVLIFQFGPLLFGSPDASSEVAQNSQRPRRGAAKTETKVDSGAKADAEKRAEFLLASVERKQWKQPALTEVVRYDPFALPAAFPQPVKQGVVGIGVADGGVDAASVDTSEAERAAALAAMQLKLQELQQRGVRVIIQGRTQAAAVIGDRTVHVGDDVEGFTVKAIEPDGVVVERKLD